MHSTSTRPSLGERCSRLSSMPWPFQRLQIVFVSALLLHAGERPHQSQQFRQQQCEAEVVTTRFLRGLHACRGAGTNADPQQGREPSAPT